MTLRAVAIAVGLAAAWCLRSAAAAEFGSVAAPAAILYDAPSDAARKVAIAPRGMPVELLSLLDRWVKVRDLTGQVLWISRADLARERTVIATVTATVRAAPQDSAALVLRAERGVVFQLVEPEPVSGWVRVRHQDGASGFVRVREVWGL
jgi:SH3-like domain-containing protein